MWVCLTFGKITFIVLLRTIGITKIRFIVCFIKGRVFKILICLN